MNDALIAVSLIKMLYYMCEQSGLYILTGYQLEHAIKRNFGGLESEDWSPFDVFNEKIPMNKEKHEVPEEVWVN